MFRAYSSRCLVNLAVLGTLFFALIGRATAGDNEEKPRKWKDDSGTHEVVATFVALDGQSVRVKKSDGSEIIVPLSRLSRADQDYVALRKSVGNPFETAQPAGAAEKVVEKVPEKVAGSIILLSSQLGEQQINVPGLLFSREGDETLVVVDYNMSLLPRPAAPGQASAAERTYTVVCGQGAARKRVTAKYVAGLNIRGKMIFSVPASEIPAPLFPLAKAKIAEKMPVTLVGWDIDTTGGTLSFARATEEGVASRIFRDVDGQPTRLQIDGLHVASMKYGVAVSRQGELVGWFSVSPNPNPPFLPAGRLPAPDAQTGVLVAPASELETLCNPEFGGVRFAPVSGDESSVQYEFVVVANDPFRRLASAKLSVGKIIGGALPGQVQPDSLKDATELPLREDKPSEINARLMYYSPSAQSSAWIAPLKAPNPGTARLISVVVQLSYRTKQGVEKKSPPMLIVYDKLMASVGLVRAGPPARDQAADALAKIPGINGRPLDAPQATPRQDGGYQITSKHTAVRERSVAKAAAAPFPQPKKGGGSLAKAAQRSGNWEITPLNFETQPSGDPGRTRAAIAYSPDGKYLFAIDGGNVLHKISTDGFTDELTLETGAKCDDLSYSKAGLIVNLNSSDAVWVVDPVSLQVKREIPIEGAVHVAGSPATDIGFAFGSTRAGSPAGSGPTLFMIDFSKGEPLHRISATYPREGGGFVTLSVEGRNVVEGVPLAMRMSDDGKYLFLGNRSIERLHLDGADLIFEECSRDLQNGHTTHFEISRDGHFAAMPTGGGNAEGYGIAVLDGLHLNKQVVGLHTGPYPCAIAFDPQTGNFYAPGEGHLHIFGPRGGEIEQLPANTQDIHRLIVDPRGRQFIIWDNKQLICYRYDKEGK